MTRTTRTITPKRSAATSPEDRENPRRAKASSMRVNKDLDSKPSSEDIIAKTLGTKVTALKARAPTMATA